MEPASLQAEFNLFPNNQIVVSTEEWREIPEFPAYQVSSLGRFRNARSNLLLTGTVAHNGYIHIGFIRNGTQVWKLAHRVVASSFLEKPSPKHDIVNHRNRIRSDNRISNLEWATRSHNAKHWRRN